MDRYDIIADEYDAFFPAEGPKLDFMASRIEDDDARLLDFTCAAGGRSPSRDDDFHTFVVARKNGVSA